MAEVRPFKAMMYDEKRAGAFCEALLPAHDIIPPAEQARLYEEEPHNAIRLELAPGEGAARYANAAATLRQWLSDGTLTIRDRDAFYVYEEEFTVGGRTLSLRGLIARVVLEAFSKGRRPAARGDAIKGQAGSF